MTATRASQDGEHRSFSSWQRMAHGHGSSPAARTIAATRSASATAAVAVALMPQGSRAGLGRPPPRTVVTLQNDCPAHVYTRPRLVVVALRGPLTAGPVAARGR